MKETSRNGGTLAKASASVFTAVFAPVLVSVILQGLDAAKAAVSRFSIAGATSLSGAADSRDIVVSQGQGRTRAAARQDALRAALLRVIVPLLDRSAPDAASQAVCEDILRNPCSVIIRCEDVDCKHEGIEETSCYRQDVLVELAHRPLLDRLRAACLQTKE